MTRRSYIPTETAGFPGAVTTSAQGGGVAAEMDATVLKADRMSLAERLKR